MLLRNTMMSPKNPRFEVREDEVNHRQMLFGLCRITSKSKSLMGVSKLSQVVSPPSVSADNTPIRHVVSDKTSEGFSITSLLRVFWEKNFKANTPSVKRSPMGLAVWASISNLDSPDNSCLMVNPLAFSFGATSDKTLINLDREFVTDSVSFGSNHARSQFVEDLKGSLVIGNPKLTLELDSGLSGCLSGNKISRPKPSRKWGVSLLHNRPSGQRRVFTALFASENDRGTGIETVRFGLMSARGTSKAVRPSHFLKIFGASHIVRKCFLKFKQGSWESSFIHALSIA